MATNIKTYGTPSIPPSPWMKRGVVAAVVAPLLLTPGSGGAITPQGLSQIERWVDTNEYVRVEHSRRQRAETRSPAEQVASIRAAYGLNMTELANLLGVSRPTAYAWLNGQEPKDDSLIHIHRLATAISDIEELKTPRIDKIIRRPIFAGRSLIDKIKANENIFEALVTIKALAEKEATARLKQKGSGKSRRSIDEVGSELSTPSYDRG